MSRWNIAAAQYAPRHNCVDEHVKHHLHFIAEAAWHGCDLIVFPELSLTGPGGTSFAPLSSLNNRGNVAAAEKGEGNER